jgi:hypothetical protein
MVIQFGRHFNALFIPCARWSGANWFVPKLVWFRRTTNMKAHRKSGGPGSTSQTFEFVHQRPDCVLKVENDETGVRICATRGVFSARDKEFFVRHLAAEGFIPDRYRWFSGDCGEPSSGLDWCVEDCYLNYSRAVVPRRRANAFMIRLLVCVSILWMVEIALLFLKNQ